MRRNKRPGVAEYWGLPLPAEVARKLGVPFGYTFGQAILGGSQAHART
jgi:hypothetical protein